MNATQQARQAYGPAHAHLRSGRSAELQIISEVTARLKSAEHAGFAVLAAAIHDNRRLWSRIAADVAEEGNGLPVRLRAQIFYLAEFTEHHSRRVLRREAEVAPLIDINSAMIRGLGGQPVPEGAQ